MRSFGGPLQTKVCSMLAPFIVSLSRMMAFFFLGRIFGGPGFHLRGFFGSVDILREDPYHGQP